MTKSLTRILGVAAAAPIVFLITSCRSNPVESTPNSAAVDTSSLPATAATVNGTAIPTSAVVNEAFADDGPAALGQLIDFQILDQTATQRHIVVSQSELDSRKQQMIGKQGQASFAQQLAEHHISMAQVDSKLRHEIILEKLAENELPPPDLMVHIRTILIATAPTHRGVDLHKPHSPADALSILHGIQAQLKSGKSFEDLAREYSEDPYSRPNGGDLGVISIHDDPFSDRPNMIGGPLWNAAQGLKPGQVYPKPVKSYLGYHLVQVVSWSTSPLPDDSKIYAGIVKQNHDFMLQRLMQGTMARLRSSAKIDESLFQ